ncbi:hypothetical protein PENFLA_c134G00830 [Penicillium flavigenum]|uniref:Uncharacterized protein n=1 Tax=Penicillium flavigenum TaxID=254877 RepID=A0A1V6S3L2_9EURO|nr:hypothetical protein PENFLA_c134G00830 [Penicillium flavigenum]
MHRINGSSGMPIERGLAELGAAQAPLPQWVDDQVEELINALRLVDKRRERVQGAAGRLILE